MSDDIQTNDVFILIYLQEKYKALQNCHSLGLAEEGAIVQTFHRIQEQNNSHFEATRYDAVKKICDEFFGKEKE